MTTHTIRRAAPDPIFEKVAKYRAAWDALSAHTDEPVDASGRLNTKCPEYKVWCDTEQKLGDVLEEAEDDLISTQPRTQAGAAAVVKAYLDVNAGHFKISDSREGLFLETLLAYLDAVPS